MFQRLMLVFIGLVVVSAASSQAVIPEGFSFQSIARDASGNIAPSRVAYIQIDIMKGAANTVSVYSELHQVTTTSEGIFNIVIGNGTQPSASFAAIKWSDAAYSLKVKIAVTPATPPAGWRYQDALVDAGTVQLLSVPYAKVAGNGVDTTKILFLRDTAAMLAGKLSVADSLTRYVTPSQLRNINTTGIDTAQLLAGYLRKNNAVTSVSIDSVNGVYGSVINPNSKPALTIRLGDISPTSVKTGVGFFDTLRTKAIVSSGIISGTLGTAAQPNITSVGTLTDLSVGGVVTAGTINTNRLNIRSLGGLDNLSVTGRVEAAELSGKLVTGVQPNITTVGRLNNLSVAGTAEANVLSATTMNVANLTGLNNMSVTNSITANSLNGTLQTAEQPNITTVGRLNNLSVAGTAEANVLSATTMNVANLTGLNNLSVTNAITANSLNGTLQTAAQPNITTVGRLNNLSVAGTAEANVLSATTMNVANLTGLNNLSVTNSITASSLNGTLQTAAQPNITTIGRLNNLSVAGTAEANVLSATTMSVANLTGLNNLSVTNSVTANSLNGTLQTAAQPNITTVGRLNNLSVAGTAEANLLSATTMNVSNLTGLDNLSVTSSITASSLNGTLQTAAQPNITTVGRLNNLSVAGTAEANVLSATTMNVSNLTGLDNLSVTSSITANSLNGTLQTAAQPNITTVGRLNNLSVAGTAEANVLSATTMNVSNLTGLNNLSVTNSITANTLNGTLQTAAQPNITTVGTLNNLSVAGTVEAGVVSAVTVNLTNLAGLANLSVTNTIDAANFSGTLRTAAQPNITSVGELTSLNVAGTVTSSVISASAATLTTITGLHLPAGSVTDSLVTVSNGVLGKKPYVSPVDTFTADFVVNGVTNYLKWTDGETVPAKGKTAVQLLLEGATKGIHPTYSSPTLSIGISPSAGNVEIGSSISVTLSSTFTKNDAGTAITTTYKKGGTSLGGNTDNLTNLTSAVSYTVTVGYGQGSCKVDNLGALDCTGRINAGTITSSAVTYTPLPKRYWGYSAGTSPSDADLIAATGGGSELSNSKAKGSFTITPPGVSNYIFFAYPASLGTLSSITVGGFESISTFTLTTRTVVNASGYSQSYNIYVSNNNFSTAVSGIVTN